MGIARKVALLAVITSFGLTEDSVPAGAQMPFYKDRTIRLIVGLAPGGGYDLYSRVIARHLGKHIPGNPTIVVENMPGAGSVIAANYMFKAAKPDGLTPRGPSWTSIPMMARGWSETSKRSLISSLR